jgi:ketosteroid isomerase-like protein
MTAQKTTKTLDFGALRSAIERRDPDALLGFYAEDAELRVENAAFPEGRAFELRGRGQIERYLRAVCDQEMACAVRGEALFGERSVAFIEACRYGDGSAISVETVLEVAGGLIVRQIDVVQHADGDEAIGGER